MIILPPFSHDNPHLQLTLVDIKANNKENIDVDFKFWHSWPHFVFRGFADGLLPRAHADDKIVTCLKANVLFFTDC